MPEGLNPIETGKKLHEHGEEQQHAGRGRTASRQPPMTRHSRIIQICEAVLLALVTITAAWAGYSAARWGTASRVDIAQSSTLRNLATRDDLTAISLRNFDCLDVQRVVHRVHPEQPAEGSDRERRFRPAVPGRLQRVDGDRPAAQSACSARPDLHAPVQASRPDAGQHVRQRGRREVRPGNQAGVVGDNYVRITVFLAAVLFLVGIGSSFKLHGVRYALIAFGSVLLIVSIVLILRQPGLPPD